jgi:SnoaL-like domain
MPLPKPRVIAHWYRRRGGAKRLQRNRHGEVTVGGQRSYHDGVELWELTARERIRDCLARYTWAGDAGRLAELAAAFCDDGVLEIRGSEPLHGRAAIIDMLGGVTGQATTPPDKKRIVRHNLANIRFGKIAPQQAEVSSYFTVFTEIGLDHYGRYRDTVVPVGDEWLIRHRFVSTDWAAPDSTMAPPSAISRQS